MERLHTLLAGRSELLTLADSAEAQAVQWRSVVSEPIMAKVKAGDLAGAQALVDDAARARFDKLRATQTDLQTGISNERTVAAAAVKSSTSHLVDLLLIAAVVVFVAGLLFALTLRYLVVAPIARLAAEVAQVAGGDYGHEVTAGGPPELATLGAGVNEMRSKIFNDLDTVRDARAQVEEKNQQLQAQTEELTRSNRDLEQFAYVASHDLQEPLRKVASFCQLLQRRYANQLDERADQYISFAVDGAQRMQRLINDLLAFSRIGRMTSNFVDVDLNQVVSEVVAQQQQNLARVHAQVTWDALPVVNGEEPLLTALIGNLVSNSVKFQRAGEPPRVHLSAQRHGDEWEVTCADNGIGIEPEFADKVFVIFQRLHNKDAYAGTGIGLAVAKKIIEYHGGRIWVDTTAGPGTTIRFTLPVQVVKPVSPAPRPVEEIVS